MLKLHHLNNSRSQRILWLLEELGVDYDIIHHQRDATTNLAPDSLKSVHPLGKSPVIEDDDRVIGESAYIVDYLIRTYGSGKFMPAVGTEAYEAYQEWLHFAEGSAALPVILNVYVSRLGEAGAPLGPRITSEIDNHLTYMSEKLGEDDFFVDNKLSGVDFMLIFICEATNMGGRLAKYSNLVAYMNRIHAMETYQKALVKGGAYAFAPAPAA